MDAMRVASDVMQSAHIGRDEADKGRDKEQGGRCRNRTGRADHEQKYRADNAGHGDEQQLAFQPLTTDEAQTAAKVEGIGETIRHDRTLPPVEMVA
jgi:hypothetical protein